MRRRWNPRDTQVARLDEEGTFRLIRLPHGQTTMVDLETLAEMVVSSLRERRTNPSQKLELRLAVLERVCTPEEWASAERMVSQFPDEYVPTWKELAGEEPLQ